MHRCTGECIDIVFFSVSYGKAYIFYSRQKKSLQYAYDVAFSNLKINVHFSANHCGISLIRNLVCSCHAVSDYFFNNSAPCHILFLKYFSTFDILSTYKKNVLNSSKILPGSILQLPAFQRLVLMAQRLSNDKKVFSFQRIPFFSDRYPALSISNTVWIARRAYPL